MEKEPLVSIIVNCYNSEVYLKETIDSIFAQTYNNYEIIFWDNQSTDSTASIIKSYDDPRVNYCYAEKHTPLGEARNLAMKKVRGKLLTFLDSDDVWLPNFLERAVCCLSSQNVLLYYSNYYNWIVGKREEIHNRDVHGGSRHFKDILVSYQIGMSAAVFKNEEHLFFDPHYQLIEDYDFFLRLTRKGDAYYDGMPLMKYRMHTDSLTSASKKNWGVEFDKLYLSLTSQILNKEECFEYRKQLRWLRVRAVNAYAEEFIREGKRFELFVFILKNLHLSPKLLFPLLFLVMPCKSYFLLRAKLQKKSYHV